MGLKGEAEIKTVYRDQISSPFALEADQIPIVELGWRTGVKYGAEAGANFDDNKIAFWGCLKHFISHQRVT